MLQFHLDGLSEAFFGMQGEGQGWTNWEDFYRIRYADEMTREIYASTFKEILINDLGIKDEFEFQGSKWRKFAEGVSSVAAATAPLMTEVFVLMTPMRGAVLKGKIVQWGYRLTRGGSWATRHAVNTLLIPSMTLSAEWILAEGLGIVEEIV